MKTTHACAYILECCFPLKKKNDLHYCCARDTTEPAFCRGITNVQRMFTPCAVDNQAKDMSGCSSRGIHNAQCTPSATPVWPAFSRSQHGLFRFRRVSHHDYPCPGSHSHTSEGLVEDILNRNKPPINSCPSRQVNPVHPLLTTGRVTSVMSSVAILGMALMSTFFYPPSRRALDPSRPRDARIRPSSCLKHTHTHYMFKGGLTTVFLFFS